MTATAYKIDAKILALELPPVPVLLDGARVRHVEGSPGYAVDENGTVYCCRGIGKQSGRFREWRIVKPYFNKRKGYFYVCLYEFGEVTRYCLHVLVLRAFIGPRPEGMQGCHNDGNTRNNAISNLRYDTKEGNQADKIKHGSHQFGERNPYVKLTEYEVAEIRQLRVNGRPLKEIAALFNTSESHVSRIANGLARNFNG